MELKTDRDFMMRTLTAMLNPGETLYSPVYGSLTLGRRLTKKTRTMTEHGFKP